MLPADSGLHYVAKKVPMVSASSIVASCWQESSLILSNEILVEVQEGLHHSKLCP